MKHYRTLSTGHDRNGNKVLRVTLHNGGRGFSVQTLGNLPDTHRNGVTERTHDELCAHVRAYGTESQRKAFGL